MCVIDFYFNEKVSKIGHHDNHGAKKILTTRELYFDLLTSDEIY